VSQKPRSRGARIVLPVIASLLCALVYAQPGHAAATTVEAESASLSGGVVKATDHAGYTGSGFVGGYTDANKGNASTTFSVQLASAGTGSVKIRYANGTSATMTLSLVVNGVKVRQVSLPATANWDTWATIDEQVSFNQGANSVALTFTSADSGNINLDNITADTATAPPTAAGTLEAESATLSGGTVKATDHPGYTGSGFVGGYTDANKGNASTSFAVQSAFAGSGSVKIRYANGTGVAMTLSLVVNGTQARQISLPATANWDTWGTVDEEVTYNQGANTVAVKFTAADSGNINLDNVIPTTPTSTTPPVDPPTGTLTHQAEKAFVSGGPATSTSAAGYDGSGYLAGFGAAGSRAVFSVNAATAKTYPLVVRYRTPDAGQATITLSANGTTVRRLTLPATSGAWANATTDVPLRADLNTVTLRAESGDNGNLGLDGIDVTGSAANAARGATMPYTAYELENGTTNGSAIGPDRTYLTVASESSGRRAVVLDATGEYVQFTLTKPANALTLRYSIPDNAAGTGVNAPLSLYANGTHVQDLALTSRYSWVYGAYPYDNNPGGGSAHHFYDEARARIGDFPAGTVIKLQKDAADNAASYTLDLAETETVAADQTMPATGFVSATTLGVTANDGSDDTSALNNAINTVKSQGKGLWLPAGAYDISGLVNLPGVALRGAGEWATVLRGKNQRGGLFGTGGTSTVQDLTIAGDVTYRLDNASDTAIEGNFGTGSTVQNVWIEHTKTGAWIDAPTNGMLFTGLRIRDTFADGVNLHKGVVNSEVSNTSVRNTGDDGLAMYSEAGVANVNNAFRFTTVQVPLLANTAAIYGGTANRIEDSVFSDTVNASAGIAVSTRNFGSVEAPFAGTTSIQRNTLQRTGGLEPNWNSRFGALWIFAETSDITAPVLVKDLDILDSTYSGILVSFQKTVTNLTVQNVKIQNTGLYGIEIISAGSGTFSGVTVSGAPSGGLSSSGGFTITRGAGNTGW
jgi:hypothetical protein